MKWLFDSEGPFISGLSRIFDVMFLALLTFVCCIPIVTAGAAISAMYDIMIKMVLDRDHGVFKPYFVAFAKNFKKGTLIWLICLAGIAFIGANFYLLSVEFEGINNAVLSVVLVLVFILTLLMGFTIIYAFPLQARYENKVGTTLKNALFISIVQFPRSIGLLFMNGIVIALAFLAPGVIPMLLYLEFSVVSYITAHNMVKVFIALGDKDAKKRSADEDMEVAKEAEEAESNLEEKAENSATTADNCEEKVNLPEETTDSE